MIKNVQIIESVVDGAPAKQTSNTATANGSTGTSTAAAIGNGLAKIIPLILGLKGISLLFGKGLFGGKGGSSGGHIGKIIGGGLLALVIPGLWSSKSLGDRLGGALDKAKNLDFLGALGELGGFSTDPGAQNAINGVNGNINRFQKESAETTAKAKEFTQNAVQFTKLVNWLKKQNYIDDPQDLIQLTLNIALIPAKSLTTDEKSKHGSEFIGILYIDSENKINFLSGHAKNFITNINSTYSILIERAMFENNLNTGLKYLDTIKTSEDDSEWYAACKPFVNGLLTLTHNIGIEALLKLFEDGFEKYCQTATNNKINLPYLIEEEIAQLNKKVDLIFESADDDDIEKLLDDPELAGLKENPLLNKFDENIKLYEADMKNEFANLILSLYFNQDKDGNTIYKNVDTCVIYGTQGSQHYYYCRNKNDAYLTTDIKQSVEFPANLIKKLESESPIEISTGEHLPFQEGIKILWKDYKENKNPELTNAFEQFKNNQGQMQQQNQEHDKENDIEEKPQDISDNQEKSNDNKQLEKSEIDNSKNTDETTSDNNKEIVKENNEQEEKALFSQFVKQQGEKILPYKKEERDISGNSLKDVLQKFLVAIKLPQLMKIKKPGIKVMVYETNKEAVEKIRKYCEEKLNITL